MVSWIENVEFERICEISFRKVYLKDISGIVCQLVQVLFIYGERHIVQVSAISARGALFLTYRVSGKSITL